MSKRSYRVPWRVPSACALLLCSACSGMPDGVHVRFRITHIDQVGGPGSSGDVAQALAAPVYAGNSASVNGIILVPDRCDRVDARIERDSAVLLLRIEARLSSDHDGACDAGGEVTVMQYTADLVNLPPGTYHLRVMNDYRGLRPGDPAARRWTSVTAFDGELTHLQANHLPESSTPE